MRSSGSSSSVTIAAAVSSSPSASRKCSPATAPSIPSIAVALATTGVPAEKASRTLFFIPDPENIGIAATAAEWSSGAISSGSATTSTPSVPISLRTAAAGRAPARRSSAPGWPLRTRLITPPARKVAGRTLWK